MPISKTALCLMARQPNPPLPDAGFTFDNVMIASGDDITVTMTVRVGTGVAPGNHVNLVSMVDPVTGDTVSNVASAAVRLDADPLLIAAKSSARCLTTAIMTECKIPMSRVCRA
ncbi:MAG: hypothetical protein U5K75_09990 [Ahrensia sp.]|nr:hypothetical protein [Ahrensia sp.]